MDQERSGNEAGQEEARAESLPLRHRIAAWLVRHLPALQEREQAAYSAGAMTASLYAARQEYMDRPRSHPGVVIQVAHEYSAFQLRNVMWEMEEMDRLTKAVLMEKLMQFVVQFVEFRKTEDFDGTVAYRARLIVYRTEDGGKTIIEEAGKSPRYSMRMPGDGAEDAPGLAGKPAADSGRNGSGVLPETPGRGEEAGPENDRGPGTKPDIGYEYGW